MPNSPPAPTRSTSRILVPPSGPFPAKIAILGEAPGESEERQGRPFVGASGQELDRLLHEAGILRSECFVTNVIRCRPPGNNLDLFVSRKKTPPAGDWIKIKDLWFHPSVADHPELCLRELRECAPKVVFALGNLALWLCTGRYGISDWRGSTIEVDL
jgi:hypothetical protein